MGENGAGKSTLMKILVGVYHADNGRILLDGHEVRIADLLEAIELGNQSHLSGAQRGSQHLRGREHLPGKRKIPFRRGEPQGDESGFRGKS